MKQTGLHTLDYIVFAFYLAIIAFYGYWIYKKKTNKHTASGFCAEGSLTFWAIALRSSRHLQPAFHRYVRLRFCHRACHLPTNG